jgi:hypothetical protein
VMAAQREKPINFTLDAWARIRRVWISMPLAYWVMIGSGLGLFVLYVLGDCRITIVCK